MTRRSMILGATILLLGAGASLASDVVVLKSGTMMEGDVLSLSAKELVMKIESGRSILDRNDVRSIHFDTTIGELTNPTAPDQAAPDAPDKKATPDDKSRPVYAPTDKKEFALGDAVRLGSLRLTLTGVSIQKVQVVDLLGGVNESRDPYLVLHFAAANEDPTRDLEVSGDPVFGDPLIRVEDQSGARLRPKSFGAGSRVQGEPKDGDTIPGGAERSALEVFEVPGDAMKELVIRVNAERFGEKGTIVWRVARAQVE